jgi:hypothetical protein
MKPFPYLDSNKCRALRDNLRIFNAEEYGDLTSYLRYLSPEFTFGLFVDYFSGNGITTPEDARRVFDERLKEPPGEVPGGFLCLLRNVVKKFVYHKPSDFIRISGFPESMVYRQGTAICVSSDCMPELEAAAKKVRQAGGEARRSCPYRPLPHDVEYYYRLDEIASMVSVRTNEMEEILARNAGPRRMAGIKKVPNTNIEGMTIVVPVELRDDFIASVKETRDYKMFVKRERKTSIR